MMIKHIILLTLITLTYSQTNHFECLCLDNGYDPSVNPNCTNWRCCGIRANGKKICTESNDNSKGQAGWDEREGKHRYCSSTLSEITSWQSGNANWEYKPDLCCDAGEIDDCSACGSYIVLSTPTQTELKDACKNNNSSLTEEQKEECCSEMSEVCDEGDDSCIQCNDEGVTLNTGWQDKHLDGVETHPAGFISAILREFSDPPVCVYVPDSAGKMIEIKTEPEESGNRLCVSDLKDDVLGRNEGGQGTPCDESRLKTCFPDASDDKDFTFFIFCNNEGCSEGFDVPFWLRARVSETTWQDGHSTARENVEMWCQYVQDDYPAWDVYPFDIEETVPPPIKPIDNNSSASLTVFTIVFMFFLFW